MNEPEQPATSPPDPSPRVPPAGSVRTWVTGAVAATVFGVGGFFAVQALTTHYASATVITGDSGGAGPGGGRFQGGGPGGPGLGGGPSGAAGFAGGGFPGRGWPGGGSAGGGSAAAGSSGGARPGAPGTGPVPASGQ